MLFSFSGAPVVYRICILILLSSIPCSAQDLTADVQRIWQETYQQVAMKAHELTNDRRTDEANQLWLTAVPDEKKTAADYFLIGNTLFSIWPEKALEMHQKTIELKPDDPNVQLELAMSLHKQGKYKEAATAYLAYIESAAAKSRGPSIFDALLADCLIHLGQYQAACDSWERTPFKSYRIKLAHSIYEINGKKSPFQRHQDLLLLARNKDIRAAVDLILLDCRWDTSWWDSETKLEFLKADLKELAPLFPADDKTWQLLDAIARFYLSEKQDTEGLRTALESRNLIIGPKPTLPNHGRLVSLAIELLLEHQLADATELLDLHKARFEAEILKSPETIDIELVHVYAGLLVQAKMLDEEARVSQAMWLKTDERRFAISHLIHLLKDGKDDSDPEVLKILQGHSNDTLVSNLALDITRKQQKPLLEPLVTAIKAEFKSLSPDPLGGHRTSDRLNALFRLLHHELQP